MTTDRARTGSAWFQRTWFRNLWLAYWVTLFALTHAPEPKWPGWSSKPSDKTIHVVAYFLLAGAGWLVLGSRSGPSRWRVLDWFAAVIIYGACDEVLQAVCGRYCSTRDLAADAIGAAAAIVGVEVFHLLRRGRHPAQA